MTRSLRLPQGTVQYELMRTSRRDVMLKALPGGVIRVYAPGRVALRELDRLVTERWQELEAMSRALDSRIAREQAAHPVTEGRMLTVHGESVTLRLREGAAAKAVLSGTALTVTVPAGTPEETVRGLIRTCLSRAALRCIRERLSYYAPMVGREPGRIAIRDQKTRWGSCSNKGNLNFNWKLVLAPPEAMDYVVVHELCHLREFSHSPRFWKLVGGVLPEYEFWKKWLKEHGRELGI